MLYSTGQPPPAVVVAVAGSHGNGRVPGKWPEAKSPASGAAAKSSKPSKKSSSNAILDTLNSSSSSSASARSSSRLLSSFSGAGERLGAGESSGEEEEGLVGGSAGFWRVLPAREFR